METPSHGLLLFRRDRTVANPFEVLGPPRGPPLFSSESRPPMGASGAPRHLWVLCSPTREPGPAQIRWGKLPRWGGDPFSVKPPLSASLPHVSSRGRPRRGESSTHLTGESLIASGRTSETTVSASEATFEIIGHVDELSRCRPQPASVTPQARTDLRHVLIGVNPGKLLDVAL